MRDFTLDDLRALMRACAGQDESVDLDGDIADRTFTELGYDSLAVLELSVRLSDDFGVPVGEGDMEQDDTPRTVVSYVNSQLAVR
ncbi:acyl carrier protein [Sphaerisporangium sp. TRM90804]|uniref:acyl carrier protein n=1 Tax=Sphaerisporangium sp. TRM90804 TaxID=3031113 RepID=UPI002448C81C|nr:acyl carrier protein [Sphaerisporangium sp. TRM90804]MDH2427190.1 acyl carrier protein [Sphaerisporangium sp. TRM90804]